MGEWGKAGEVGLSVSQTCKKLFNAVKMFERGYGQRGSEPYLAAISLFFKIKLWNFLGTENDIYVSKLEKFTNQS